MIDQARKIGKKVEGLGDGKAEGAEGQKRGYIDKLG